MTTVLPHNLLQTNLCIRHSFSTQVFRKRAAQLHCVGPELRCIFWPPLEARKCSAAQLIRGWVGPRAGIYFFFFLFLHWHYSPLWALACRTISFHFSLSITNSLHLLTPSTWRSLSASSFHPFQGLPLRLVPTSSWVKIFLGILSSSILSRWPNQLILCPFIHFTIFSPLLFSSSSRIVLLFHSPFSYLGPYILGRSVWMRKISPPPDRPAPNEALYRLSYPGPRHWTDFN